MTRVVELIALASLLVAPARSAEEQWSDAPIIKLCNHTGGRSSKGIAHCRNTLEVSSKVPTIFCVYNPPLDFRTLLGGGLLRLFDAETARIHAEDVKMSLFELRATSEDTWLAGLGDGRSAEQQARAAFTKQDASKLLSSLSQLRRALDAVRAGDDYTRTVAFSPFATSCVGLRAAGMRSSVNVTVEWFREGPDVSVVRMGGARGIGVSGGRGRAASPLRMWTGPALFVGGLLLYAYAPFLAESVAFHYAGGVSLAMVLGVLVVVLFVWHRTGRRRPGFLGAGLMASLGVTWGYVREMALSAAVELAREHWVYVAAYFGVFALVGYALTFWRLKGGRPADFECALLSRLMRCVAHAMLYAASHSLRVYLTTLVVTGTLALAPRGPVRLALRVLRRATEKGPAGKPSVYLNEKGQRAHWRPATPSGAFLSEDEYAAQGRIATDAALRAHFASPEYQAWLLQNHGRMKVEEDSVGRELTFSDDEDD